MAHIRRHPKTGKWQVRYVDQWKIERSKTFDRKVDALEFKAEVEVAVRRREFLDPSRGSVTLDDWCRSWLEGRVGVRPSTRARDESCIRNHVLPALGKLPLSEITFEHVQALVGALERQGLAPATIHKTHQLLSKLLDQAIRARRIRWNSARGVELPQVDRTDQRRFLTTDEIDALATSIHPRYRALVLVGGFTGLRRGEAAGLGVKSMNLLARTITVERTLVEVQGQVSLGPPKTKDSIRRVALPRFLAAELSDHISAWPPGDDGLIFTSQQGSPLRRTNFRRRYWLPAVEAAGLAPLRFHDLRHSHVSLLVAQGEHPKLIADRLGHSSPIVTMTQYAHLFPGLDEEAADRLDRLRDGPQTDPADLALLRPLS